MKLFLVMEDFFQKVFTIKLYLASEAFGCFMRVQHLGMKKLFTGI